MVEKINIARIKEMDQAQLRILYERFGCQVTDHPTYSELHTFPLERLLQSGQDPFASAQCAVDQLLSKYGWQYKIFGPNREGTSYEQPDFLAHSYHNRCIWIYQPFSAAAVNSDSAAYTLLWEASHELSHGLTNDSVTAQFGGQGKRKGILGLSLTLVDAIRALEWEHQTMLTQRILIEEDYQIPVDDCTFLREYQYNVSGSVARILTGNFANPAQLGILTKKPVISADEMNELGKKMCRDVATELGMALTERY